MKNEMALKYLKALSGAVAKKNTKSLLKPKVEEITIEAEGEMPSEELAELLAQLGEEKEEPEEVTLP